MTDINLYMETLIERLKARFADRLRYVGLQGSYARGEADENSDTDVMVIVDRLDISDLDAYREIVKSLPDAENSCGFICGTSDMANWDALEICQILHETVDYYGKLADFTPPWTPGDVRQQVKLMAGNLYHELAHRRVHGKRENAEAALPGLYKSAFYILQNLHFLRTGDFVRTKAELLVRLEGADREVLETALAMRRGEKFDFDACYTRLFRWCSCALETYARKIVVLPYDEAWPAAFTAIRAELAAALGDAALAIEHVGSTSVPGLSAKPIIDIAVVIKNMEVFPEVSRRLAAIGYAWEGDLGIPGREAFHYKGKDHLMRHHLYVCPADARELARFRALRDYLRAHPDAAAEYGRVKTEGARLYPYDIDRYIDHKSAIIQEIYRRSGVCEA